MRLVLVVLLTIGLALHPTIAGNGMIATALFNLDPDGVLMSVAVREDGARFVIGASQPLFRTNVDQERGMRNHYAASPDGQRFLVLSPLVDPNASPLVAVLNWAAGLKR